MDRVGAPEKFTDWVLIAEKVEAAEKSGLLKTEEVDGMLDVIRIGTLQQLLLRDPTAVQLLDDVAAMTNRLS